MEKTIKFIRNNLSNKTVVLGCSYGPDSMCLMDLLIKEKINVICVHVNHNIREESKKEEQDLRLWCKKRSIPFELKKIEKGNHSEAFYRKKRQIFFKDIANKYNTNIILTAHHGDDLIETILMRLTRGSSLLGYGGFRTVNKEDGYIFMKPLIFYTKDDILTYNKKNNIPYAIDKTNYTDKYQRNRFRSKVLPFLKEENKLVNTKFLEFSTEIYEASDYLNKKFLEAYNKSYKDGYLNLNIYNDFDDFVKKGVLKLIFNSLYGDDIDNISRKHIEKIVELVKKNNTFSYNLPKGFTVSREYDKLLFSQIVYPKNISYNKIFEGEFRYKNHRILKIKKSIEKNNFILRLNSSEIKLPLYIRTRNKSDKIMVKNSTYYKKIKKVFIDKKIPKKYRDNYPIVVDSNNNILWIPGIIKSKFDVDNNEKCDIILKYERKEETDEQKK